MTSLTKIITAAILVSAVTAVSAQTGGTADPTPVPGGTIRMNSVGFLPDYPKKASIVVPSGQQGPAFVIKDAQTNEEVFSGTAGNRVTSSDTPDGISVATFTEFNTPGRYYLEALGEKSPVFTIGGGAFNDAFKTMMLGMYLWRCGMPDSTKAAHTHNGVTETFAFASCHTAHGDLSRSSSGMTGTKKATGGWHDAGDYNKYIVNSGTASGLMLKAWEHHGEAIQKIDLHAPKDGNIPKYLSEIKWNLDWAAEMQFDDGWVSHKLTTHNFCGYVMPDKDTETQYFMPRSSAATGAFAAKLALASRLYRPYDAALADKWLEQAERAFEVWSDTDFAYIAANTSSSLSTTGAYSVTSSTDASFRRWAAAELWETTGDAKYLQAFESAAGPSGSGPTAGYNPNMHNHITWENVNVLAGLTYLMSKREGRSQSIVTKLTDDLTAAANAVVTNTNNHNYGRPFGRESYYWGAHGALTANAIILHAAYTVNGGGDQYRQAGHEILGHIFGRNYFGRSYVTGVGHNPPVNPHCRRTVASGKPWPGYLIGGPHSGNLVEPTGGAIAPPGAACATAGVCYFDDYRDYARNEIAINWNGSMIYALSGFLAEEDDPSSIIARNRAAAKPAAPKVKTTRLINVKGGRTNAVIPPGAKIYSLDGRLIAHRKIGDTHTPRLRRNGVFIMRAENK